MIFRPAEASELKRVMALMVPDPACALTADTYRIRSKNREYRPEWTWVAEEGAEPDPAGAPAAAGVWWGDPQASQPSALDGLWVNEQVPKRDRVPTAAALLGRAHGAFAAAEAMPPPAFHLFLPGDWRERPGAVGALAWREEAARRAGLTSRLERLRYEWTADAGVPRLGRRLTFRPEPDDEVFADLFARVLTGTLDATSSNVAAKIGPRRQARRDVAFYRDQMPGHRSWWRVAQAPGGAVTGFGIPSRNVDYPVVGYLGVLPEHRGHGYADEILAEITRILVAEAGATVIHADTDLDNRPMAAAFDRAGYRTLGRRLVLSAP
jgi:RimJ/RimL family protein N-acetyltransferase